MGQDDNGKLFLSTRHPSCMVHSCVLIQSGQFLVLKVLLLTPSLSRVMKFYLIDYVPRTQMSQSNVHCLRKLECKLSIQVGLCLSQVDSPTTPSPKKFLLSPSLQVHLLLESHSMAHHHCKDLGLLELGGESHTHILGKQLTN